MNKTSVAYYAHNVLCPRLFELHIMSRELSEVRREKTLSPIKNMSVS